jgi:tyrosinase
VPGLKVFVVSNKVTVSEDPNVPPVYAPDVKIYPEITTNRDGQGRGEGSGLIAAEVPA